MVHSLRCGRGLFGYMQIVLVALAIAAVARLAPAHAAERATLPHVTASAALQHRPAPNGRDWVAIHLQIAPGWHVYWRNPGEAGQATRIAWTLPTGITAGAIHWPTPQRFASAGVVDYGYAKAVTLLVPLAIGNNADLSGVLTAHVSWLLCSDMCLPQSTVLTVPLTEAGDGDSFAAAFAALPGVFPGGASYSRNDRTVSLTLSDVPASRSIKFFPATEHLIAYAPPRVTREGAVVRLVWPLARHSRQVPQFDGVLVLDGKSYAIHAPRRSVAPVPRSFTRTTDAGFGLAEAALFAFLGGLILNLMPCVLPILSMKALAMVQAGEQAPQRRRDGLAYAVGVLLSFAAVAGVLIGLKSAGDAIGWGFQLQSPLLIFALWLLTAAIGLNLLGLFELPSGLAGIGSSLGHGHTTRAAFFTGVLAVLVASPCTAPFMGAALGFAVAQPPLTALSVFLALGLGFAAPLTAFTLVPPAAGMIPRPGPWMVRFKELLAFPMLATAIWLLWVLEQQTGPQGLVVALAAGLGIVFLFWLLRLFRARSLRWGLGATGLAGLLVLASTLHPTTSQGRQEGGWQPWSSAAVSRARADGHPVLVDLSAAWCVTCLVNERVALEAPEVQQRLRQDDVVTLKGDWTNRDPAITALLARHHRAGVPLYLLYPAKGEPRLLPQLLTPDTVLAALNDLKRRS